MSKLGDIVAKFRKGSPNIAAAFDEVELRLMVVENASSGHNLNIEDIKRRLDTLEQDEEPPPPPPPPPDVWSGPLEITQGGTYTGNWESTTTAPTIRVRTTAPVVIRGKIRNLHGGTLVDAMGGAVQVTIENSFIYGGSTYQTSGRLLEALNFKNVTVRNCTIENTRGIELQWGASNFTASIVRNRHKNIKGYAPGGQLISLGNFVQLREVGYSSTGVAVPGNVEIGWNEVVNEYNLSFPEDIVSVFKSANVYIHDNYLEHNSVMGNAYNTSSQGTITIESGGPNAANVRVEDNQMVDTLNSVWVGPGATNVQVLRNRCVQDGYLPDGVTRMGNGWSCMALKAGSTNVVARDNVIGYVNRDGNRMDYDLAPGTDGGGNVSLPNPITRQMELAERTRWANKLAASGVTVGA